MIEIKLQLEPIDIAAANALTGTEQDGALVTFIGRARNKSKGKQVSYLEYEIYEEMARSELEKIARDASAEWTITDCLIVHRYGRVNIGEASIIICVSSPHRDESFQAARFIIDTIKKTVPIWKKEFYSDGSQWISDRS
ncbi:MAG: molybdenum cofactor biosynthesis protein MoaE [Spirochaetae bacterium HGW-Spirochaetae-1]|jgi:molybdopterin synthase catalytic subunit|nr:MAG: molybdenum cofactor biosynthesis protein MoaE [Spirochaetae bacterium HGW-Spirochaetae-1]